MKIFKVIYTIKETEKGNKIKIFNPSFVRKYKKSCKIIYNGKVFPLTSKLVINEKHQEILEIKLICYTDILDINDIFKGCESFSNIYKVKDNKNDDYIFKEQLKYSRYQLSKMVYSIKPGQDRIKIFGKNFVINNKDKCTIIYQEKNYSLTEFFLIQDIKTSGNKLEIILKELEDIYNRSYWFEDCQCLEEFSFVLGNEGDFEVDNKKEKYFEKEDEKKFEELSYFTKDLFKEKKL